MQVDHTTEIVRREIVFVEDNVGDYQLMLSAMRSGMEVVLLDHTKDGLDQMLAALDGRGRYDGIHILSHGGMGRVDLGVLQLSASVLDERAADLAELGRSLTEEGDLLLYGCDVAEGNAGQLFVDQLAKATGADVAASDDLTGAAKLGGDWKLEESSGEIQAAAVEVAGFDGVLALPTGSVTIGEAVADGAIRVNELLTAVKTLSGANAGATYTYEWQKKPSGSYVTFATGETYRITQALKDESPYPIRLKVTYSYFNGTTTETATFTSGDYYWISGKKVEVYTNLTTLAEDVSGGYIFTSTDLRGYTFDVANTYFYLDGANKPAHGKIYLYDGVSAWVELTGSNLQFTQTDINAGRVKYVPTLNYNGTDTFKFTAYDKDVQNTDGNTANDAGAGNENTGGTLNLTITPTNDPATGVVAVSGTPKIGTQLTATETTAISDIEGLGTFTYYWQTSATPATESTWVTVSTSSSSNKYTPTETDGGKYVRVQVKFSDGRGSPETVTSSVTGTAINARPVVDNDDLTVDEDGGTVVLTPSDLQASDIESGAGSLTFKVVSIPGHGKLYKDLTELAVNATFTQQDIIDGKIKYRPDDEFSGDDGFDFTVTDAGAEVRSGSLDITVTNQNDAPTLDKNAGLSLSEDAAATTIGADLLKMGDVDDAAGDLVFVVGTAPTNGVLKRGTVVLSAGSTFTQADINSDALTYRPNLNANGSDALVYSYSDGEAASAVATFLFTIGAVNDAPVLSVNDGLDILEEAGSVVIDESVMVISDVEQAVGSLLYTVSNVPAKGILKLGTATLSAGNTFTQADVEGDLLTFTPAQDAHGSDGIVLSLSDGVGGTRTVTFGISITNTNDAPSLGTSGSITLNEDASGTTIGSGNLLVNDTDNTADELIYRITTAPTKGAFVVGTVTLGLNDTFTQEDVNSGALTYEPGLNENGTDVLVYSFTDGMTAAVTDQTFSISINAVNDAPNFSTNTGLTVQEDAGATVINEALMAIGDPEQAVGDLRYTIANLPGKGVLVLGSTTLTAGSTLTQADIDGDTLTYRPDLDEADGDSIVFTLTDGVGGSRNVTFGIAINAENDAPTLTQHALTINEDAAAVTLDEAYLDLADVDNDAGELVYSVTSVPTLGVLKLGSLTLSAGDTFTQADVDGDALTFHPASDAYGTDALVYTYSDDGVTSVAATFAITVNAVNDAPTFVTNDTLTVTEDGAAGIINEALLQVSDVEQGVGGLVYTIATGPGKGVVKLGTVTLSAGNTFTQADVDGDTLTYTPSLNQDEDDSIVLSVADGVGGTRTGTFNLSITSVNDAPTLTENDGLSVAEDAAATTIGADLLQLSDVDTGSGALVYRVGTAPTKGVLKVGSVTLSAGDTFTQADIDGDRLTFRPTGNVNGTDALVYTYGDGVAPTGGATFTITISAVDDAPDLTRNGTLDVTEDDAAATSFGNSLLQMTDIDTGDGALVYTVGTAPTKGVLKLGSVTLSAGSTFTQDDVDTGTLNYKPNANEYDDDALIYTYGDGTTTATATFAISIASVDDAPTLAENDALLISEDAGLVTIGNDLLKMVDIDTGDSALIFRVGTPPVKGVLKLGSVTLNAGSTFTQDDIDSGALSFTPAGNVNGTDDFVYTYRDGTTTATATFAITIAAVNDAPTLTENDGLSVGEDASATTLDATMLRVTDVDTGDGLLVYTVSTGPTKGIFKRGSVTLSAGSTFTQDDVDAGDLTFTPTANLNGTDALVYTYSDGNTTATATFDLTISAVNDAPTLTENDGLSVAEDAAATTLDATMLQMTDVDTADSALVYTVSTGPAKGIFKRGSVTLSAGSTFTQDDVDGGDVTFTPTANLNGTDALVYTYSDGNTTATATFNLTISASDDAPTLTENDGLSVAEDAAATTLDATMLQMTDIDTADSALVYTVSTAPSKGIFKRGSVTLSAGSTFTQDDVDGGDVTFTPTANLNGTDALVYTYSDGTTTATATFDLTVSAVNDAPTLTENDGLSVAEDASATTLDATMLQMTDIDTADSALVYTVSTGPAKGIFKRGSVTLSAGSTFTQDDVDAGDISFTPTANLNGTDELVYTYSDGNTTATATFDLSIGAVNDAPTLTENDGLSVAEDAAATTLDATMLQMTDIDTADSALVYTVSTAPGKGIFKRGSVTLSAGSTFTQDDVDGGDVTFTPTANLNGTDALVYTYSDGNTTATATFDLTISAVNDAPTLTENDGLSVAEDASATTLDATMLQMTDVDTADSALVYTVGTAPAKGVFMLGSVTLSAGTTFTQDDVDAGDVTFTPTANLNGTDALVYTYSDGNTTATATFNLTISATDDAPTLTENDGLSVAEDAAATTLDATMLQMTDIDTADSALVYTVSTAPGKGIFKRGSVTLSAGSTFTQDDVDGGDVTFTPTANLNGTDALVYTYSDGNTTATATFNLTISAVNDAPTLTENDGLSVAEDASATTLDATMLQMTDVDTADSALVYTVSTGPTVGIFKRGSVTLSAGSTFTQDDVDGGDITFTPAANTSGTDALVYTYSDGNTTATATFNLTVSAVNDAPTLTENDGLSVAEDAAATTLDATMLQMTDVDTADSALVYTVSTGPAKGMFKRGSVTLSAGSTFTQDDVDAGDISFTPTANLNGTDALVYTYSDGNTTATATFNLTISASDDAPTLTENDGLSVAEDAAATTLDATMLQMTDIDTADSALVYTVSTAPSKGIFKRGSVTLSAGSTFTQDDVDGGDVTFTPTANLNGTDALVYTYSDGTTTATATFDLTVSATNDAPTLTENDGLSVAEDAAATTLDATMLQMTDIDTADSALVYTVGTAPAKGVFKLGSVTLSAGTTFTQDDVDAGDVTFTPTANLSGTDALVYTYSDGNTTATATFDLTISATNDAPTLTENDGLSVAEDAAATTLDATMLQMTDIDTADSALVYKVSTAPTKGIFKRGSVTLSAGSTFTQDDVDGGDVTFTPTANLNGTDALVYTYSDGNTTATATFDLTISAVNDAPTLTENDGLSVAEDASATTLDATMLQMTDVDTADSALVYTVSTGPAKGIFKRGSVTLSAGSTFTQDDVDGGDVTFTPTANLSGTDALVYTYSDGNTTATATFDLTISATNDAPTLTENDGLSVAEDAAATTLDATMLQMTDIDTADSALVYTVSTAPGKGIFKRGSVTLSAGSTFTQDDVDGGDITFTPTANLNGTDALVYTYSDGATTATATFDLTISAVNDAPTLTENDGLSVAEDAAATTLDATMLQMTDVDTADSALVYTVGTAPAKGMFKRGSVTLSAGATFTQDDVDGGDITFTPTANLSGTDALVYTYSDGNTTATATFDLTISATNDAPTLTENDGLSVAEDASAATIDATMLQMTDVDTADSALIYTVDTGPAKGVVKLGTVTLSAGSTFTQDDVDAGDLTFTPTANLNGTDALVYTYSDGNTTATATFNLSIGAVNDAPTLTENDGLSVAEDAAATTIDATMLQMTDIDTADSALVYTVSTAPAKGIFKRGSVTLSAGSTFTQDDVDGGDVTFTPTANLNGTDALVYTYSDGNTTGTATFDLTISAVNDAPTLTENDGLSVAEDAAATTLDATMLQMTDVDTADSALVYTVGTAPAKGVFKLGSVTLSAGSTFTQDDVDGGALSFTPTADLSGTDALVYTYSDGNTTATATFDLTISATNDAPTLTENDGLSVAEDAAATTLDATMLQMTDIDTADSALVYTVSTAPGKGIFKRGSVTLSAGSTFTQDDVDGGDVTFTPTANLNGTDALVYTYSDGNTTATATFDLTISATNDAPTLTENDGLSVAEDASATTLDATMLQMTDVDTADSALIYTVSTGPAKGIFKRGSVTLSAGTTFTQDDVDAGDVTFTPTANLNGTDALVYTYSDGNTTATATFNLTISATDDAPTLTENDGLSVAEDAAATTLDATMLQMTDIDTADSALVYTVSTAPGKGIFKRGSVTLSAGSTFTQDDVDGGDVSFTPTANLNGTDALVYTYSDGNTTATATFNLTISAVNDAPTLTENDGLSVAEDAAATTLDATMLQMTDIDTADSALVYTVSTGPAKGVFKRGSVTLSAGSTFTQDDVDGGAVTFTPTANLSGTDALVYTYSDGNTTATATFDLTISATNDAPTLTENDGLSVAEDAAATTLDATMLQMTDVDTADSALVYTVSTGPAKGMFKRGSVTLSAGSTFTQDDVDAGDISFTPTANLHGTDALVYTYSDGNTTATATFNLTISAVNDAPTLTENDGLSVAEDAAATTLDATMLQMTDIDTADSALVYTVSTAPAKGIFKRGSVTLSAGSTFTQDDVDGGDVTFTPTANLNGTDALVYTYSDGTTTATATFDLTVSAVNDAPTLTENDGLSVTEDAAAATIASTMLQMTDVDTADGALVYTVSTGPAKGVVKLGSVTLSAGNTFTQDDVDGGALSFTPTADLNGTDALVYTYSDGNTTATATFNLTIGAVNDAPTLTENDGLSVTEDAAATTLDATMLQMTDIDTADGALVYRVASGPAKGVFKRGSVTLGAGGTFTQDDVDAGDVTFTPTANLNGTDALVYTYSDGTTTATATFNLTISAVNDAPTLTENDGLSVTEDAGARTIASTMLQMTDVDTADGALVYTVGTAPAKGIFKLGSVTLSAGSTFTQDDVDGGALTFTPTANLSGTDALVYTYGDGNTTATATFDLTISAADDAPTLAENDGLSVTEDAAAATIDATMLRMTDVDTADSALVFTVGTGPAKGVFKRGTVSLGAGSTFTQDDIDNGDISFTPTANLNGTDKLVYTYGDGTTSATATFNLTISAVNDAPTLTENDGLTVAEDAAAVTIGNTLLQMTDIDTADSALIYRVGTLPAKGTLKLGSLTLSAGSTFTQDDVDANKLTFRPGSNLTGSDAFVYSYSDGVAATVDATFSLSITASNDAPVLVKNTGMTLAEDATATAIGTGRLQVTDVDSADSSLVYTVGTQPGKGVLLLGTLTLGAGDTFTQDDVDSNALTYRPDANANGSDSMVYSYADGTAPSATGTFAFSITPVNDAPTIAKNDPLSINEDAAATQITSTLLAIDDVDQLASARTYTITALPAKGVLKIGSTVLGVGSTFTQANINAGNITYTPHANATGGDSFGFNVSDGAGGTIGGQSFTIGISAVNDAPGIAAVSNMSAVANGDAQTIARGNLLATDPEQATSAIVYSVTSTLVKGTLMKGGIAITSFTQADIDAGLVKYRPNSGTTGVETVAFDVTDGVGGTTSGRQLNINIMEPDEAEENEAPVGEVVISGALQVNGRVVAQSGITDADGMGTLNYQWERSVDGIHWDAIAGAVRPDYGIVAADRGYFLRTQINYVDGRGNLESLTTPVAQVPSSGSAAGGIGNDGTDRAVESNVPDLFGSGKGDGNGDKIADHLQKDVTSLPWAVPVADQKSYVTFFNNAGATHSNIKTTVAPVQLPANLTLPVGQLEFELADVAVGGSVTMTVYIDSSIHVNGYWKQNAAGAWVNVADSIEPEGSRTKITFTLQDGGEFDHDHTVNGHIVDPGGAGFWSNDLDRDQIPDAMETLLNTTAGAKDNNIYDRSDLFVMQMYRDILHREGTAEEVRTAQLALDSGAKTHNELVAEFIDAQQNSVGAIARVYLAAQDRMLDMTGLDYWMKQASSGLSLDAMAEKMAQSAEFKATFGELDNSAFVDLLYQRAFHRAPDAAGKALWLNQLESGETRSDVLVHFAQSAEMRDMHDARMMLTMTYMNLLGRAPDAPGMEFWLAQHAAGMSEAAITGMFVNSAEYHSKVLG